jgi:hypothetical protein
MTRITRIVAALMLAAAPAAFGADVRASCASEPNSVGLPERIENLKTQMNRIEWSANPEERRRLMDLHMKVIHEGLRELDRRGTGGACRTEMINAMMEQMVRHHLAMQDETAR